ncbi:MAG: aspartate--tRNA ligase [Candidatus Falkowbacteria bacterium]|nr:MAG: aspartate--tRNA ligase [Candidatus Falkowbacteria bacterium]
MLRTHTCGELRAAHVGQEVTLAGWVNSARNLGGLMFIDLRDHYGLVQTKIDPLANQAAAAIAEKLHSEWVVKIKGQVAARPEEMKNSKMATGEIEIIVSEVEVLSQAQVMPFEINEEKNGEANEALRLKYRFLDLRRPKLQKMLETKDAFITYLREYFHSQGFTEIQTPILANSSPEGARDFLVPSRLYPGKFYALPQAPQQFKQLLMVAGMDKYFQIAPCFRDEDPRMDRHYGEFYQLDMEMSFVEQEDIFAIMEPLMKNLVAKFSEKEIINLDESGNFKHLSWQTAMDTYGSDKPDLRFAMPIVDVSEAVKGCGFSVFEEALNNKGVVKALRIEGGAKFSRKEIDELIDFAKRKGAKGLAYLSIKEGVVGASFAKFLSPEKLAALATACTATDGDLVFFAADVWRVAVTVLGAVRNETAAKLGLKDNTKAAFAWIVDFPMYDYSEIEEGRIDFGHNPFSMPQGGLQALKEKDPLDILAYQYDLVLNGFEISSGAIRNHEPEIMYEAFKIAGYTKEDVEAKFGAMLNAFSYGAPPHGGNAPGLDRILMILNDWDSIRDIYAFPKDGQGRDLMTDSPSEVFPSQLAELSVELKKTKK